ncbi:MAG: hypothetical protein KF816_12370 [Melioribacteraceae bacterium]|jgi:hypothetical protein|nr:hypothetical protein [Melioribacteraceae bacterium]
MLKKSTSEVDNIQNWTLNSERAFWESRLDYRISFYILFLAIIVAGSILVTTKEMTLFILSIAVIILWVLTAGIINAVRKVNIIVKELSKNESNPIINIDKKAKGKLIRFIQGFLLPIVCSSIFTLIFLAGLTGVYDLKPVSKSMQSLEKEIKKQIEKPLSKQKKDNPSKYFQAVDSVSD